MLIVNKLISSKYLKNFSEPNEHRNVYTIILYRTDSATNVFMKRKPEIYPFLRATNKTCGGGGGGGGFFDSKGSE